MVENEENKLQIGDIIPIQQVVGFEVVKRFDDKGEPVTISTQSQSEAEILSRLFKLNSKEEK